MSQGFDFGERPRRNIPWLTVGAASAVIALAIGLTLWLSGGHTTDISDDLPQVARTTTTVEGVSATPPPEPNGDGSKKSTCKPINQGLLLSNRSCRIAVPGGLTAGERVPAVILLHGLNTSPETEASNGDWQEAASRDRFTLVLPEGQLSSWNAGGCCGVASGSSLDDTGYLAGVLKQVAALPTTDPARIYVVGESNGGMMAYTFGCAHSELVAAIVSVSGTPVSECDAARPIPVLHIHGRADDTVPYAGGRSLISMLMGVSFPSVESSVGSVAQTMGCTGAPTDAVAGKVTTRDWTQCAPGVRVRLVAIDGLGHQWPTRGYDATSEIERFLGLDS